MTAANMSNGLDHPRVYLGWCPRCQRGVFLTVQCYRSYDKCGQLQDWHDTHVCPLGHVALVVRSFPPKVRKEIQSAFDI